MGNLFGLTEHQPWGSLIAEKLKPIENRDWPPPPRLIGSDEDLVAIHAGKQYDKEGEEWVRQHFPELKWPAPVEYSRASAILAVAQVAHVIARTKRNVEHPRVIYAGDALERGLVTVEQLRWFTGEYGWVFGEVVKLPTPVPCRGMQKLWRVPSELLPQVRQQFRAARPRQERSA